MIGGQGAYPTVRVMDVVSWGKGSDLGHEIVPAGPRCACLLSPFPFLVLRDLRVRVGDHG